MNTAQNQIFPGLHNPVLESQQIFRQLLKSMSEPGVIGNCEDNLNQPDCLQPATYAVALSLLDQDTALKLSDNLDNESVRDTLRFHNGIPLVNDWKQADFVICNEDERPDLDQLNIGNESWPDQSCTLIIQCQSFYKGIIYRASGPGIKQSRKIRCSAFNGTLIHQREKLASRFPLGIDLILTSGRDFFCIPRTTTLIAEQN